MLKFCHWLKFLFSCDVMTSDHTYNFPQLLNAPMQIKYSLGLIFVSCPSCFPIPHCPLVCHPLAVTGTFPLYSGLFFTSNLSNAPGMVPLPPLSQPF